MTPLPSPHVVSAAPLFLQSFLFLFLPLLLVVPTSTVPRAHALSSSSPWSSAPWRLTLDFGLVGGENAATPLREGWGSSGAHLVLPVSVTVSPEYLVSSSGRLPGGGGRPMVLLPRNEPATYVNSAGEQRVALKCGGWRIQPPSDTGSKGRASTLSMFLELDGALERNDVTLPSGEAVLLKANSWRESEFDLGLRAIRPLRAAAEEAQHRLESVLSHETGDRRLDGIDLVDTAKAYGDMARLVAERDGLAGRLREAERAYPRKGDERRGAGWWPGSDEKLVIGEGSMAVSRKKFWGEEACVLGTWRASPIEAEVVDQ